MSRRVTLNPHVNDKPTSIYTKHKKKVVQLGNFKFGRSSMYGVDGFFRYIGEKVARALQFVRSSHKVSLVNLPRSKSYAENLDCQRAEAMEDCIRFLNSSSSLKRSNSAAG